MKKLLGVIALVAIAYGGYRYTASSGVESKYKAFAEEMLHRRYEAAAAMTDGLTKTDLEKLGSQERIGAGPPMFQTLFPSHYTIDSRETAADGSVTLHATQTIYFNPAGVESAMRPAMYAILKQVVTMRKGSDGWRVTSFANNFEKMDTLAKQ